MPAVRRALSLLARQTLADLASHIPEVRGKTRVLRGTDKLLRLVDASPLERRIGAVRFALDTEDGIDFALLYRGGHQAQLVAYLASRLGPLRRTFWDLGANVGSVSLPVLALCPHCTATMFEPSPTVMPRLLRNLALNPELAARARPLQIAVSDHDGTAQFFVSRERFNSGVGGIGPAHNRASSSVEVRSARADTLIAAGEVDPPDLIKVDVEGYEFEVMQGLEPVLRGPSAPEVVFEHCVYRLRDRGRPLSEVVDLLRSWSFELFVQDAHDQRVRPLIADDLASDCDIIARRPA